MDLKIKTNLQFGLFACAALAGAACGGELVWPCAGQRVEAGRGARVCVEDGVVNVATDVPPPGVWPAAYFVFDGTRDLSRTETLRVTFTNRCDRPLRLSVKVKGDTVQGRLPEGGLVVPPHASRVKELSLFAEAWVFDKPHGLLGLKRNPSVGGGSSYSLEKVRSVAVFVPPGTERAAFGVTRVEAVPHAGGRAAATVLKADTFAPWVDEFGQANFAEWPDKIHSRAELLARAAAEERELDARPEGIPGADRFGGWAAGPQLKATGFFRTEKVDGRWWFVDPDGRLFFAHGVNMGWNLAATGVTGREAYFEKLPPREGETKPFWTYHPKPLFRNFYGKAENAPFWSFSFSAYNQWLKFGAPWRVRTVEHTLKRMRAWGLNAACGGGTHLDGRPRRMPFIASFGTPTRTIEGMEGYWGKLVDPFAPEFEASVRRSAERLRAYGTNEWCLGWTVNNELSWGTSGAELARGVLASPDGQPAKEALVKLLAAEGRDARGELPGDVLTRLGEAVAERYYSVIRAAIKAVAPNHLYMGDRNDKCNMDVFRVASRYLDVVTVNVYDHRPAVALPEGSQDRPLMVTEFHFGCYDTGYFYASLIPVRDQTVRAQCYRDYVNTAVDNPNYVGAFWFCWRDCPITGQLHEGANAQCGLVSTTDVPYGELVGAVRDVARAMYPRRAGR